jgi:hypothetical protein
MDNRRALELIEREHDAERFCACGRHTTVIDHAGRVWLECSSHDERPEGAIARITSTLTAGLHTRRLIVDLRPLAA